MQVDKLFGTSKIVGKILNQYQIDYVMNLKKKTVKYYVMSSPHVISCVGIKIWHRGLKWCMICLAFLKIIMFLSQSTEKGFQ